MSGAEKLVSEKTFLEAISHPTRRRVLEIIYDRIEASYTELLEATGIGEGTLNFHLRKLEGFLQHTPRGTYILSEHGRLAIEVLGLIRRSLPRNEQEGRKLLSKGIMLLRTVAFLIDAGIFFIFSGVFLDPELWVDLLEMLFHLSELTQMHPWIFHPQHIAVAGDVARRIVGTYSHIFFAVYIVITVLEAFKGQTPGKYAMGIRVVKMSGGKVGLIESAIRNAGKVFLLPLDLIVGLLFYRKRGFVRFFDYYTEVVTERVVKGMGASAATKQTD